jgi:alpha-tubulin suppressor-like RCC1 family protein
LNQCTGSVTARSLREIGWLEGIVESISLSGTHTCTLAEGSVHCYGRAAEGQVGNGDPIENLGDEADEVPVPVVSLPQGVVTDVTVGSSHSCAVLDARDIYCWGRAADGRLGNGNATNNVGDAVGEMPPTMTMLR